MSADCGRCDGDGEIERPLGTLGCPNCRDVCQWCNSPYDDGEELGDTGLVVCRPCIRDMAAYKEDVEWQLHVMAEVDAHVDSPGAFRDDLSAAVREVFRAYDFDVTEDGDWMLRNAAAAEDA